MTNEEKQLLLVDLCGRLPYGTKIECGTDYDFKNDITDTCKLLSVNIDNELCEIQTLDKNRYVFNESLDTIKPYLRPLSSMTGEEEIEMTQILEEVYDSSFTMNKLVEDVRMQEYIPSKYVDWLNKHHFDYRGLIPKGLALEAPEDMYNH